MAMREQRPLVLCLTAYLLLFAAPLFIRNAASWQLFLAAGVLALLLGACFLLSRQKPPRTRRFLALCGAVFCLIGAFGGRHFSKNRLERLEVLADGTPRHVTGFVREVLYEEPFGTALYVTLDTVNGERKAGTISLALPFAGGLSPYDRLSFTAVLTKNEAEYDSYLRSRGVILSAEAEAFTFDGKEKRDIQYLTRVFRAWIAEKFDAFIGGKAGDLASALLTGDRERIDGQTALGFKRLGISHLLAVSGLHLSVIIGGADLLLRRLTLGKKKRILLLTLLNAIFVTVCGFSASVLRASLMLCFLYLSELLRELHDPLTALFAAVSLIVTVRPFSIYDAGLWLSFLATLGILLVSPLIKTLFQKGRRGILFRLLRYEVALLILTVTATFFTLPVIYLINGNIALLSPVANLVFVPIIQVLLYLLALLPLISFLPFLPAMLGKICRLLIDGISALSAWLSEPSDICLSLRYPFSGAIIAVFSVGMIAILLLGKKRIHRLFALFLAFGVAYFGAYTVYRVRTDGNVRVLLHNDGKNDVVAFIHDGTSVLIDITAGGKSLPLEVMDSLDAHGICETDLLVLTHLHANHIRTLPRLADKMKIRQVLLPDAVTKEESDILSDICSALQGICKVSLYPRDGNSYLSVGTLRVNLPRYETISRSAHPIILFSTEVEGTAKTAFIYAGASSFELSATAEATSDAVFTVCGAHGPVTKNIYSAEKAFDGTDHVIFQDPSLMSFTKTERIGGSTHFLRDDGSLELLFTN